MTTKFIGTTFPPSSDWHVDEVSLINNIKKQIDHAFPHSNNLLVNTTWFGPQFDNGQWSHYKEIATNEQIDRLFLLAAADPVFLNQDQLNSMQDETHATLYLLGHFDTEYYFNFHSQVLSRYFKEYNVDDLHLQKVRYVYLNYNRKPRDHRSALVNCLINHDLLQYGVVTLGKKNNIYSRETDPIKHLTLDETPDDVVGNWGMDMRFGIPHDIHSLGNLELWQQHFLNVVGETEFFPWDNMFISEKTWKPILGLRPFLINGQTKIYQYLRDQGFKTFNQFWSHIEVENVNESQVHDSIVQVIQYLHGLGPVALENLYQQMLPDLLHNRQHFAQYASQQQNKINNLFS